MAVLKEHIARILVEAARTPNPGLETSKYVDTLSRAVKPFTYLSNPPTKSTSAYETMESIKVPSLPKASTLSCSIPDINAEGETLNRLGLGLSEHETLILNDSILDLASKLPGLTSCRLWGKVLGIHGDYYIIETEFAGRDLPSKICESRGFGANRFTYFACSTLTDSWSELPNVTPAQLRSSRTFKTLLTGRLASPAPHGFPGCEADLLRTLVARISAGAVIAPADRYMLEEDQISDNPDFVFSPETEWVHARERILKIGLTAYPEPADDEPAEISLARDSDPVGEKLQPIADDSPLGGQPAWVGRRSRRWPGAVAAAQAGFLINFYCGYGLCAEGPVFLPESPLPVFQEISETAEVPEPYPQTDDLAKAVE